MPGNLAPAAPATVLPNALCTAFTKSMEYFCLQNTYLDGSNQRSTDVDSPRRTWKLTRRLTPTLLEALAAFYFERDGPAQAFWYYDPFEPATGQAIGSNYDSTGASAQGQYIVRFEGNWKPAYGIGRSNAGLELVEID
jgi:hypothetical protein